MVGTQGEAARGQQGRAGSLGALMRGFSGAVVLCILAGGVGRSPALDVWLDSAFGPPDTIAVGSVVRFGAYAVARYPAWGRVFFFVDVDGTRIYEDDENFILGGGDSVLFDWPLLASGPGYYTARDSLVIDLGERDSTQVTWKFWVVATGVDAEPESVPLLRRPFPTLVHGERWRGSCCRVECTCTGACAAPFLLDAAGRKVMELRAGLNDIGRLAPGIYFIRFEPQAVQKVVVTR